jgi:ferric-dicitrate binding protein FerR (iron transport regulator)
VNKPSDWALLARYLSGECTEEEKAEVESAIASDPEKRRLTRFMRSLWDTPEPPARPSDVDRLWDELAGKTWMAAGSGAVQDPGRRGIGRRLAEWLQPQPKLARYCAASAALLIVSSLAYHGFQETGIYPSSRPARLSTLAVESSASDELTLSDGTRIRLDAGSTLRYPESFRGDGRSVFLSGEGYFEVAPDADRPFRVHLDRAVVEVLGTRFNIRAWETEQRVTVAWRKGGWPSFPSGRREMSRSAPGR